jgi:hypothetical protein
VKLAGLLGVPVMMLSWAGCLIVYRHLRLSACGLCAGKAQRAAAMIRNWF